MRTAAGLNSYRRDEGGFKSYSLGVGIGSSSDENILSLLVDQDCRLWVGTASGSYWKDASDDVFIRFSCLRCKYFVSRGLLSQEYG
ncbi:MAG: hypothetical protein HC842_07335 [Cytophagales bacterium]|nr:hypothetical protein [Cytophagales bacterium]